MADDRSRLWELVELLHDELVRARPNWPLIKEAARELWERIRDR
jgi:hypothetical protein